MTRSVHISLVLVVLGGLGCGTSAPPYRLAGEVRFEGELVPIGEIVLMPDPARGNRGPMVMAEFRDGRYVLAQERGHVGGAYLARLTGFDGKRMVSDGPVDPRGTPLFAEVVVPLELPPGPATWDFVLPLEKGRHDPPFP